MLCLYPKFSTFYDRYCCCKNACVLFVRVFFFFCLFTLFDWSVHDIHLQVATGQSIEIP